MLFDVVAGEAFDLKLRRRYAHEWEFLATVLDRVLLIVFSCLVILVTGFEDSHSVKRKPV